MLLTATFLWMKFDLPVRVSRVIDHRETSPDGPAQVWGYSYLTLSGHIERGEMTFEVVKMLGTGEIRFRIHSFSQTGHIPSWLYRIGYRLVGHRLRMRFVEDSLLNMRTLVSQRVARREDAITHEEGSSRAQST